MTGHAYATSAKTANRVGPFAGFTKDKQGMIRVLSKHRDAISSIDATMVSEELLSAASAAWDDAVELGSRYGVRNSQASVLAPTGTIGLMMDCDTTGIEPDLGLVKHKKLVGGGTMSIVNQTVPRALKTLGYAKKQIDDIVEYIDTEKSILGAPHLKKDHVAVFACSMGDNPIHYEGHVRMMGAVQPFLSGAISKTVNMPEEATVEAIEELHLLSWKLGIKAVAIYRDNCKVAQPLSMAKKEGTKEEKETAKSVEQTVQSVNQTIVGGSTIRQKLPKVRDSKSFSCTGGDCHGYLIVGEYEDGRPGELFVNTAKMGSTLSGLMESFGRAVSFGLQHGVPLKTYVKGMTSVSFAPAGITDDSEIRTATSLIDYVFRRLALSYLSFDDRLELGLASIDDMPTTLEQTSLTDVVEAPQSKPVEAPVMQQERASTVSETSASAEQAPMCYSCGNQTQRSGSCYVCTTCGSTTGCS